MSTGFAALQRALPQHLLSRGLGTLAASETPWLKDLLIREFARAYKVSLDEAEIRDPRAYRSFNDFFTRALQPDARPVEADPTVVVHPADGAVSQAGTIAQGMLLQAKGHGYRLDTLAGPLARGLHEGQFCTIYLAPFDYHRVHLPFAGNLTETLAVPGDLFSVNTTTEASIPGLFARNERLVCRFETDFGPMLVILVGALIVASIETVWPGPASPYETEERTTHDFNFAKGEEIGRFLLGSTVICCFPPGAVVLDETLQPGCQTRMGMAMARLADPT
ncbi:MAG: archaetidylserine decarboxylase [Pseudomonadota bacterium]